MSARPSVGFVDLMPTNSTLGGPGSARAPRRLKPGDAAADATRAVFPFGGSPLIRRLLPAALAAAALLALPAAADAAAAKKLYVSLGDSYASGYEATAKGVGSNTTNGFAYQVPGLAKKRGHRLKLVNFGCGGATTTSLVDRIGCPARALGPKGIAYDGTTQLDAAEKFIKANRGRVALITVSIGGNDVTACAREADPVPCVAAATNSIKENVSAATERLRKATGPKTIIVGTTYPDVILGEWLNSDAGKQLAGLSTIAFKSLINPALKEAYATGDGKFVDVTAATGAYGPMDDLTDLAPYGSIPTPVAKVCRLTYYCQFGDIHARRSGYRVIAKLVAKKLPKKR
jgi:lysophospholipase L1-like esterase